MIIKWNGKSKYNHELHGRTLLSDNLGQIFYSTSHFIDFSDVMYLFVDEESIYESSKKIGQSVFVKTAILCQI